ncbi:lamin tail domain-containing protein [Phytoactinopolyspora alkaliphila]|uniref:Lamin tail domain-containing protein n=1 Tax=Phytoactinopolyspora alkaliphila TaxID=1783498 RepID=A0A6N9YFG1_9ACTN|nr:lamin tail domain-containing protein [Phytoactinopolyspora alkaliphila]
MKPKPSLRRWGVAIAATTATAVGTGAFIQAVHADPPPPTIEICCVDADVHGADLVSEHGEHVTLTNTGTDTVSVGGFYLVDAASNRLDIGSGYVIPPGGELRVYTGPGTNATTRYYNGRTSNVLNNDGDTLWLYTADDDLVHQYEYTGTW